MSTKKRLKATKLERERGNEMAEFQLNHSEREAIRQFKALARTWPKTLWLFSANGTLYVMRKVNGKCATTKSGGMDDEYAVEKIIGIDNDGGDW